MSRQTVVLLGASNVTFGWRHLISALRIGLSAPLDIFAAGGLGRSYLGPSRFAHRSLPGILDSQIWNALKANSETQTRPVALVTDLGNDLVYGCSSDDVVQAANQSIERLREFRADIDIVLTRPPRESVDSLSPRRFRFFASVLFPFRRMELPDIQNATAELDDRVVELARRLNVAVVKPELDWYGLDPIHIRRACRVEAFCRMAEQWDAWNASQSEQRRVAASVALPIPHQRTAFGRSITTPQPSRQYRNADIHAY
ncbi:MAG: hypothetical protein R3C19_00615 [Planctomycetaceae bacterium]